MPVLVQSFGDGTLDATQMDIAFDGTSYWGVSGGTTSGARLVRYSAGGGETGAFSNGIDYRSVFTDASNNVYTTDFGGGGFLTHSISPAGAATFLYSLGYATVDFNEQQLQFDYRPADGRIYGHTAGVVRSFSLATGALLSTFSLTGFVASGFAWDQQIGILNDTILTWGSGGVINAWDFSGNNLGSITIPGIAGGNNFPENHSFGAANGLVWYNDGTTWRGYDIFEQQAAIPEPTSLALLGMTAAGFCGVRLRRRRTHDTADATQAA